ncbi:hypothetical protein [Streptomyces subrutilus]|uniref:hypothetical protein n=1 Tax=Streptomyces subrutilus TaxID=36818 RepID=UPI0033C36E9B
MYPVTTGAPAAAARADRRQIFAGRAQIRALAATGQAIVPSTHRLHSVRGADVIHVLKDGRAAESGTFAELMDEATGTGEFRNAQPVQAAAFADSPPAPGDGSARIATPDPS